MTHLYSTCLSGRRAKLCLAAAVLLFGLASLCTPAAAQPEAGVSVSYDFFPFSDLANPNTQPVNGERNFEQDVETRVMGMYVDVMIPAKFSNKTMLQNSISYHRRPFDYEGWDEEQGGSNVEITQAIEVSSTLTRQLSYEWSGMISITPGLYSDFENDITGDDFNISVAAALTRRHNDNLSYGFGFFYTFIYGEPLPLPLVTASWTNGSNLSVETVLPSFIEVWYATNPLIELGLVARVSGNRYHGSPDRFKVANPQLRYAVGTVGPSFRFHLGPKLLLQADSGVTFLRRFEFYDGSTEIRSIDMKQSYFFKAALIIGN